MLPYKNNNSALVNTIFKNSCYTHTNVQQIAPFAKADDKNT